MFEAMLPSFSPKRAALPHDDQRAAKRVTELAGRFSFMTDSMWDDDEAAVLAQVDGVRAARAEKILEAGSDRTWCWLRRDKAQMCERANSGSLETSKGLLSLSEFALDPKCIVSALTFKCGCKRQDSANRCVPVSKASVLEIEDCREVTFETPLAKGARKRALAQRLRAFKEKGKIVLRHNGVIVCRAAYAEIHAVSSGMLDSACRLALSKEPLAKAPQTLPSASQGSARSSTAALVVVFLLSFAGRCGDEVPGLSGESEGQEHASCGFSAPPRAPRVFCNMRAPLSFLTCCTFDPPRSRLACRPASCSRCARTPSFTRTTCAVPGRARTRSPSSSGSGSGTATGSSARATR